jgi:hypothetical protein
MKQETKEIYLDEKYQCGGFYEFCIQVCSYNDCEPIKQYTNYIWNLDYVYGPVDKNFDKIKIDNSKDCSNYGVLMLAEYEIPFLTINVCEDIGYNWFDISIYTAVIEKIFGKEYIVWNENLNIPILLKSFWEKIAKELYNIFPFQLGISGFEVSGEKYIEEIMEKELKENKFITYYIGENNYELLSPNNKRNVIKI